MILLVEVTIAVNPLHTSTSQLASWSLHIPHNMTYHTKCCGRKCEDVIVKASLFVKKKTLQEFISGRITLYYINWIYGEISTSFIVSE